MEAIDKKRFGGAGSDSSADLADVGVNINSGKKTHLGITEILNDRKSNKSDADYDISVTQILKDKDANKPEAKPENAGNIGNAKPVEIKRFNPKKKAGNKPVSLDNLGVTDTRDIPDTLDIPDFSDTLSDTISDTLDVPDFGKESKKSRKNKNSSKRLLKTVVIDAVPIGKPAKPAYLSPEEKERLQKLREEELLEKEMALEDPHEILDSINPYDVKNIETPGDSEIINVKLTKDIVTDGAEPQTPLLAEKEGKEVTRENPVDEVKEYKPAFEVQKWQKKRNKKLNYQQDLDITPVLESLNKSFAQKRKENLNVRRTLNVDGLSAGEKDKSYKGKTIPAKLNIDYKKQILEDSAVLPHAADLHSRQLEQKALGSKKKRKVRDFIFEDIDEDDYEFEHEDDDTDEYDSYDSSDVIRKDLDESSKGLKWRFSLLLVVTAVMVVMTFINDMGGETGNNLKQYIIGEWFNGASATYAATFVYANLIAGVIGMCLCSGVIVSGLKKLFTGKADCDSACAVPCVMTTIVSIAHIAENESTALLQQGMAHVYVSVALCALLFNTLGKIFMIERAKKNFLFISGDNTKYSAYMPNITDDSDAKGFTKGLLNDVPAPVFMRKTEFLTDYLKNSYCVDWADSICRRLVPAAAVFSILMGIVVYFLPIYDAELSKWSLCWAVTAIGAFISVLSPFSIMFLVNNPLLRASNALSKSDCVVMGFTAAQKFSNANAAVVDAAVLFPAGSVKFLNVKRCQKPNAINSITIDESIVISASLAIKSNSIMSSMFYDMIAGADDILYKIENPVYEVNMGITGWMGNQRVMLGNREQMKYHGVDIPGEERERKYRPPNADVVYLAVGSEAVAMFFIEVLPNPGVKNSLQELDENGFVLSVKTKDSFVTVAKLADIFELEPSKIRILSFDQHAAFDDYSRYTSRGSSEIACNGTFTSFAKALVTAKTLIRDMIVTSSVMFMTTVIALLMVLVFVIFAATGMLSASTVIIYNVASLLVVFILQGLRRY